MTAPGDFVIIVVLVASFVACAAYAVGRIHQRWRSGADREEAYRHGFDSGTRSVFGMAARAAGRRRERGGVHGSAGVPTPAPASSDALAPGAPGMPAPRIPAPGAPVPGVSARDVPVPGVPVPGFSARGVPVPGAPVPGVSARDVPVPGFSARDVPAPRVPVQGSSGVPLPGSPVPEVSGSGTSDEPTVPVDPPAGGVSASDDDGPTKPVRQVPAAFPAPRPQTGPGLPPPAANGGVTYTSLPDPRWAGGAERLPEQGESEPRRGRHTVPEELVQAATYVLPPDRVARAKVVPRPEDPGPPVPRPRGA